MISQTIYPELTIDEVMFQYPQLCLKDACIVFLRWEGYKIYEIADKLDSTDDNINYRLRIIKKSIKKV